MDLCEMQNIVGPWRSEKKKEYRAAQTNMCANMSVREVQHIWRGVLDADGDLGC